MVERKLTALPIIRIKEEARRADQRSSSGYRLSLLAWALAVADATGGAS